MSETHAPSRTRGLQSRWWLRGRLMAAALAVLPWLPLPALAQVAGPAGGLSGGDCRAVLSSNVDGLLQAISEARSKRSSLTLGLKLMPIDARLRAVRSQLAAEPAAAAQCQALAGMLDAERARLMELIPERLASPAPQPAAQPQPQPMAEAPVPSAAGPAPAVSCGPEVEQARLDLQQRVVGFMQDGRADPGAMESYLDFSRRLASLDGLTVGRPGDCAAYSAAVTRAQGEWRQLTAQSTRPASPPADPALSGTMPLIAMPGAERCVANLRMAWRELHLAASNQVASARDPAAQERARQVEGVIVQQQLAAFGNGPMTASSCDMAHRGLAPVRNSVAALRAPPPAPAAAQTMAGGMSGGMSSGMSTMAPMAPPASPPMPAQPSPPSGLSAAPPSAGDGGLLACDSRNRGLLADLEREKQAGRAAGRLAPSYWSRVDQDIAMYRGLMLPGPGYALQCAQIAQQLSFLLGNVRQEVARVSAQAAPPPPSQGAQPAGHAHSAGAAQHQAAPPMGAGQPAPPPPPPPPPAPHKHGLLGGLKDKVAPPPPTPAPPPPGKTAAAAPPPAPAPAPPPPPPGKPAPAKAANVKPGGNPAAQN